MYVYLYVNIVIVININPTCIICVTRLFSNRINFIISQSLKKDDNFTKGA